MDLPNLPHRIEEIDGKHIGIDCPKNKLEQNIITTKDFFSMILLAVCDARYNFVLFDVGQYGSTNDSGALENSNFGKAFNQRLFKCHFS